MMSDVRAPMLAANRETQAKHGGSPLAWEGVVHFEPFQLTPANIGALFLQPDANHVVKYSMNLAQRRRPIVCAHDVPRASKIH